MLTATDCADDDVRSVRKKRGQLPLHQRHQPAHDRPHQRGAAGHPDVGYAPHAAGEDDLVEGKPSRAAPQTRSVEERKRRGSCLWVAATSRRTAFSTRRRPADHVASAHHILRHIPHRRRRRRLQIAWRSTPGVTNAAHWQTDPHRGRTSTAALPAVSSDDNLTTVLAPALSEQTPATDQPIDSICRLMGIAGAARRQRATSNPRSCTALSR